MDRKIAVAKQDCDVRPSVLWYLGGIVERKLIIHIRIAQQRVGVARSVNKAGKNAGEFDRFCSVSIDIRKGLAKSAGQLIEPVRHLALIRDVFKPFVGHLRRR